MTDFESESFIKDTFHYLTDYGGSLKGSIKHKGSTIYDRGECMKIRKKEGDGKVLQKYLNMTMDSFRQLLYESEGNLIDDVWRGYIDDFRRDGIDIDAEVKLCNVMKNDIMELQKWWFGSKDSIEEAEDILYIKVCNIYNKLKTYVDSICTNRMLEIFNDYCEGASCIRRDMGNYTIYGRGGNHSYNFVYDHVNNEVHFYRYDYDYDFN